MRWNGIKAQQLLQSPRFLLCLLSALIVLIRCLTFDEPYERDLMVYAVTARELLSGRPLYSDLWDIKPPGIYGVYALAQIVVGYSRYSFFLLGVFSAIIPLYGVFRVVMVLTETPIAALWSAFYWAVLCSDILLQANQPNVEVFLNAFFVWAFFYFLKAHPNLHFDGSTSPSQSSFRPLRSLFLAGFLWGLASLFKQVALTTPLLLSLYILFSSPENRWGSKTVNVFTFISPILLIWAGVVIYFWATGRWDIFYFTMVEYGRLYSAENARFTSQFDIAQRFFPNCIALLIPLVAFASMGLVMSARAFSRIWIALGLCALSVEIAVVLPGNYFPHYFQLWLPLICIAAGVSIAGWKQNTQNKSLVVKATVVTGLITIFCQWPNWNLTPDQVSIKKYDSTDFVRLPRRAKAINALLLPNETFYQYGFDAGFYFETGRRAQIGILNVGAPYIPLPRRLQDQIIADIARKKPEMAIVDLLFQPSRVTDYLDEHYVPVPHFQQFPNMVVMARRGGALLRRQQQMAPLSSASRPKNDDAN